jgi:hypothetical protein
MDEGYEEEEWFELRERLVSALQQAERLVGPTRTSAPTRRRSSMHV